MKESNFKNYFIQYRIVVVSIFYDTKQKVSKQKLMPDLLANETDTV